MDLGELYKQPFTVSGTGDTAKADGRAFKVVRLRSTRKGDNATANIAVWEGRCATCGARYEFTAGLKGAKFSPNQRCRKHHQPGRKITRAKSRESGAVPLTEIEVLRAENKDLRRRLKAAERELVKYRVPTPEGRAFAEMCKRNTAEIRAKMRKLKKKQTKAVDPFG